MTGVLIADILFSHPLLVILVGFHVVAWLSSLARTTIRLKRGQFHWDDCAIAIACCTDVVFVVFMAQRSSDCTYNIWMPIVFPC